MTPGASGYFVCFVFDDISSLITEDEAAEPVEQCIDYTLVGLFSYSAVLHMYTLKKYCISIMP